MCGSSSSSIDRDEAGAGALDSTRVDQLYNEGYRLASMQAGRHRSAHSLQQLGRWLTGHSLFISVLFPTFAVPTTYTHARLALARTLARQRHAQIFPVAAAAWQACASPAGRSTRRQSQPSHSPAQPKPSQLGVRALRRSSSCSGGGNGCPAWTQRTLMA